MAELESLFRTPTLAGLGPEPRSGVWSLPEAISRGRGVAEALGLEERPAGCLVALTLLWHDHLGEAHARVQDLPGADAAFVHGILHRREPDYSNARYWFHRVGRHAVGEVLADAAAPVLSAHAALPHRLIRDGRWDGLAFIDAVAAHYRLAGGSLEVALLQELQWLETVVLARHLAGTAPG